MGIVDCSNCKCNVEDESILIIENSDKHFNNRIDIRKEKIEQYNMVQINKNQMLNVRLI